MNHIKAYTTAIILIFLSLHQISHSQQVREFSNTSGKIIKASIVSATAEEVTLLMENGKTIVAGVNFFSEKDQKYIKDYAKKNPVPVNYDFTVKATKTRTDRDKTKEGSAILATYETWVYKVNLENRSRIGRKGADLKGLSLHYNIVLTPKSEADRLGYLLKGSAGSGKHRIIKGKASVQTMAYLDRIDIPTKSYPITKSELAPGYYYPGGGKDNREDDIEGIIVKVLKGKDVVFETSIGGKSLENVRWSAP